MAFRGGDIEYTDGQLSLPKPQTPKHDPFSERPWDEFNRVPIAGKSNKERLSAMLDEACFALLVLTAEDQQPDGEFHARQKVVHEAGLFQGRLGFERAIILLEQGCEQFSNVEGLGQIRFPKCRISACFEDVRAILEREGIVPQPIERSAYPTEPTIETH